MTVKVCHKCKAVMFVFQDRDISYVPLIGGAMCGCSYPVGGEKYRKYEVEDGVLVIHTKEEPV